MYKIVLFCSGEAGAVYKYPWERILNTNLKSLSQNVRRRAWNVVGRVSMATMDGLGDSAVAERTKDLSCRGRACRSFTTLDAIVVLSSDKCSVRGWYLCLLLDHACRR